MFLVTGAGYPRKDKFQIESETKTSAGFTPATLWLHATSDSRKFGPAVCWSFLCVCFIYGSSTLGGNKQLERRKLKKKRCPGWGRRIYWDIVRQLFAISSCSRIQPACQN